MRISYLVLTILTCLLFFFTFRTWQYDALTYPLMYSHDGIESLKVVKHLVEGYGYWQTNPFLGSPEGSNLYINFPTADGANIVLLKLLIYLTTDYVLVLNGYIFLSYLLVSWAAYFVLRKLHIHWYLALLGALVFSFLPYHQIRTAGGHIFLINYATVPFSIYITLSLLWVEKRDLSQSLRSFLQSRSPLFFLGWLLALVAIGSNGTAYYAFFTVLLWALAALISSIKQKSFKPLVYWVFLTSLVTAVVLCNISPALMHAVQQQSNEESKQKLFALIERDPIQIEEFGFRLNRFFVPLPSRFVPFNDALDSYAKTVRHELFQFPGFLAILGVVVALFSFFPKTLKDGLTKISKISGLSLSQQELSKNSEQTSLVAILLVGSFLLFSTGGGALLIGHTLTTSIRSYGRVSIFIAFLGIVVLSKLATLFISSQADDKKSVFTFSLSKFTKNSFYKSLFVPVIFTLLAGYSLLYQSSLYDAHTYGWQTRILFDADRAFMSKIEQTLPQGTRILQLPLVQYPEARGQCLFDSYDHLRPYLHTNNFYWSFGALPNSETWKKQAEWQKLFEDGHLSYMLGSVTQSGYDAIYIDARSCLKAWDLQADIVEITNGTLHSSEAQHALIIDISGFAETAKNAYLPGL